MEFSKEQEILQKVISESWSNPSFKKELMASPQEAIKKLTGETFTLPDGKTLKVFDQSESDVIYLNIPEQPNLDDLELTDAQLETVAGGMIPKDIFMACFLPSKNTLAPNNPFSNGLPT